MSKPDGNWIDEDGVCRTCGGEIPHGHTNSCDVYKLEMEVATWRAMASGLAFDLSRNVEELDEAPSYAKWQSLNQKKP